MIPKRWHEESGQLHSLPLCLRALFEGTADAPSTDEFLAALGLGSLTTAPSSSDDFDVLWGEEAFLPATAALFGIRLRELHPRRTARGLDHSAEFPQHFIDSYVPLIARALEVGQPTLVCRGWPPPRQHEWGLVTRVSGESLAGMTIGHQGEPVPLIGPPLFAYVVEEVNPELSTQLSPEDLVARAAWIAIEQQKLSETSGAEFVSGAQAFSAWIEFCRQQSTANPVQSRSFDRMIMRWIGARLSMISGLSKSQASGQIGEATMGKMGWKDTCMLNCVDLLDHPEKRADKLRLALNLERVAARENQLLAK